MDAPPPRLLVAAMHRLLPPASREAVLGDLWETYRTPGQFVARGLAILPFLIVAQLRRRSSWPMLNLQAFVLFACLRGFAPVDAHPPMWMRAALPTAISFLALAWHDTYRGSQSARLADRLVGEAAAVVVAIGLYQGGCVFLSIRAGLSGAWLLSATELLFATSAIPVLAALRAGWGPLPADAGSGRASIADLSHAYAMFCREVRWRNRLEVAAMTAVLLIGGLIVVEWHAGSIMVWLTMSGFFSLVVYLLVWGEAPHAKEGDREADICRIFRREILRQHRLRSGLAWWWIGPLFVGVIYRFTIPGILDAAIAPSIAGIALCALLARLVDLLNRQRGVLALARIKNLDGVASPTFSSKPWV